MFQSPERSSTGQSNPRPNNELGSTTSEATIACRRTCTIKTVPPFLRAPCRNICEDSPPALEACTRGAAGGDPVASGSPAQWFLSRLQICGQRQQILLLAVQDEGSKMTTLAQGTLQRSGSTGVVQQGVRQAQDSTLLVHAEASLPVDFLLVKKVTLYRNPFGSFFGLIQSRLFFILLLG